MSLAATAQAGKGWNAVWERDVYAQGRQLNRYPYDMVVAFVLSRFGGVADRSRVRLLEVGCGAGNNLWFAAREGFSVAGIDGSRTAISHARERFHDEGLRGDLQVGTFTQLPWEDHSFDAVIDRMAWTTTTREHVELALAEAQRVLKPGGSVFSMVYSAEHPDRDFGLHHGDNDYSDFRGGSFEGLGDVHLFTRQELEALYRGAFKLEELLHLKAVEQLETERRGTAYWRIIASRRD